MSQSTHGKGNTEMIMIQGSKVWVDFHGGRRLGKIVRPVNPKSLWVVIMLGAESRVILKRHLVKHNVVASMVK